MFQHWSTCKWLEIHFSPSAICSWLIIHKEKDTHQLAVLSAQPASLSRKESFFTLIPTLNIANKPHGRCQAADAWLSYFSSPSLSSSSTCPPSLFSSASNKLPLSPQFQPPPWLLSRSRSLCHVVSATQHVAFCRWTIQSILWLVQPETSLFIGAVSRAAVETKGADDCLLFFFIAQFSDSSWHHPSLCSKSGLNGPGTDVFTIFLYADINIFRLNASSGALSTRRPPPIGWPTCSHLPTGQTKDSLIDNFYLFVVPEINSATIFRHLFHLLGFISLVYLRFGHRHQIPEWLDLCQIINHLLLTDSFPKHSNHWQWP